MAVVVAHHFCRWNDVASSSSVGLLQRVSQQLATFDGVFASALRRHVEKSRNITATLVQRIDNSPHAHVEGPRIGSIVVQSERAADVIEDLIRAPLREALSGPGPCWLMLVDAPDELDAPDVTNLILGLGELPPRFRVVVATRPRGNVIREFEALGAETCWLASLPGTMESLTRYVRREACNAGLDLRVERDLGPEGLIRGLLALAGDNFLVARCALQALDGSSGPITMAMVRELPADLGGYFRLTLGRLDRETRGRWPLEAGPILGAFAVARGPLAEVDLASICRLPAGVVRIYLTRLRPFLEPAEGGCWRLFHATLAEFLLDQGDAEEFWCPSREQHGRFADWVSIASNALRDWDTVPDYGLKHVLHHVIEADGGDLVRQVDSLISEPYLRRRIRRGATAFDLSYELRRALVAVSDRGAVCETLFLALLLAHWQDRAAANADPSSTILLAATGKVKEAVELAMRQDEAAHSSAWDGIKLQAEFAAGLVRIGEIDAAFQFAGRLAGEARSGAFQAAFSALAIEDPAKALDVRSHIRFEEVTFLQEGAFCALASHPLGLEPALGMARRGVDVVRVSEGCARHDPDRALDLVRVLDVYPWWLGGDRGRLVPSDATANVLSAFLEHNPGMASEAWRRAEKLLGLPWPSEYGLILAGRFAQASPELGRSAFERLKPSIGSLAHMLAASWLGSKGGDDLFTAITDGLEMSLPFLPGNRATRFRDRIDFDAACRKLALIRPSGMPREGAPSELMNVVFERLMFAMGDGDCGPEDKSGGAEVLGELAGWVGDHAMAAFFQLAERVWIDESWKAGCGRGFAASLARRGASAYVAARTAFSGCAWWHGATLVAANIVASRNAPDMLGLIDSVEPKYFKTRAELIGIAAVAMRRSGIGSLEGLRSRLSRYVDGAQFESTATILASVTSPRHERSDVRPAIVAKRAVDAALKGADLDGMREAAELVEALPRSPGIPFEGETVWADDLRRALAEGLGPTDPGSALLLLVPTASMDDFRSFAADLLLRYPPLRVAGALAEWVRETISPHRPSWSPSDWVMPLATGFALALSTEFRTSFLNDLLEVGSQAHNQVLADVAAFEDPIGAIERITERPVEYAHLIASPMLSAVQALATQGDPRVFAVNEPGESLMTKVGRHWPIERWRSCLDAYKAWDALNPDDRSELRLSWLLEALLPRAAAYDARRAFEAVDGKDPVLPGFMDKSWLLWRMIGAIADLKRPPEGEWPLLLNYIGRIEESTPRGHAILEVLSAARRLPAGRCGTGICQTIATAGLGPRELVLNNVEAVVRTAIHADPRVADHLPSLLSRTRMLLAVELEGSAIQ